MLYFVHRQLLDQHERARLYLQNSPTKYRILQLVADQPRYLSDLAEVLDVTPPTIFQHGEELIELGVVNKEHVQGKAYLVITRFGREFV